MQQEMDVSQAAFTLVRPMYDGISLPEGYPVDCPPGNLSDAIALLQVIDLEKAIPISDKLTSALDDGGYFNFLDQPIANLGDDLLVTKAKLKLNLMDLEEVRELEARIRLGQLGRREAQQRHAGNAVICAEQIRLRGLKIFERHYEMHHSYALRLEMIANWENEVQTQCAELIEAFDKANGD
jgi:hypothetical protein